MAGHNLSGYMSSLWQALFAAFTHLFARVFHFASSTNNNTAASQQQQHPSPPATSATTPGQNSQLTAAGPSTPLLATASPPAQYNRGNTLPDLEKGQQTQEDQQRDIEELDQDQDQDEAMAASKKRGGNKRSSYKPSGAQPVTGAATTTTTTNGGLSTAEQRHKENMVPGSQVDQSSTSTASKTDFTNGPAGASGQFGWGDDKASLQHAGSQMSNSIQPSDKSQDRHLPTFTQSGDTTIVEDSATGRETPKAANGTQTPVAPAEHKPEYQKAGSDIQTGTQNPDSVPDVGSKSTSTGKENGAPSVAAQVEQTTAAIDRLALDDNNNTTPGPEKALTKDTAAIEAAGVPIVVVNPTPGMPPIALKPLAPLVTPPSQVLPGLIEPDTEEGKRERVIHLNFMREALKMGDEALAINETPVGCVLVYKNRIIAKGMNATNVTRNGTRHAEFMALSALLSHQSDADVKDVAVHDEALWGDVDASDGHIYPYGQKLHPSPKVNRAIISECILYVTVEPCVMCASLLRQLRVKKVYFGAVNDKFGGTGGVFRIHVNSKAVAKPTNDRPYQNGYGPQDMAQVQRGRSATMIREEDDGDGGNVEPGYPAEGGFLRDEAVSLLRRFYVQENGRAPQPRKKEGRAARLFAMENAAANGGVLTDADGNVISESPDEGSPMNTNGNSTPVLAA